MAEQTGWAVTASDTNAITTATKAAVSGKQHIVHAVSASFASTTSGILLQILDGVTVVFEDYIYDSGKFEFPRGISITKGGACSAVLAASGGAVQKVNLHGVTR